MPFVFRRNFWELPAAALVAGVAGSGFYLHNYVVAASDEWIVRTGMGINTKSGLDISKKTFVWPIVQKCVKLSLRPRNYHVKLLAKSQGMMEFGMPAEFTISPDNTPEALERYAQRVLQQTTEGDKTLDELVYALIDGGLRGQISVMPIEDVFNNRKLFRDEAAKHIGEELFKMYGLALNVVVIKDLYDAPGSNYFDNMQQRILVDAEATAAIATAEAMKNTQIGKKERERDERIQLVKFEQQAVESETAVGIQIAEKQAELKVVQAEQQRKSNIAELEAEKRVAVRTKELEKTVEERRIATDRTTFQANDLSRTQVDAEVLVTRSTAEAEAIRLVADANFHQAQAEAAGNKAKLYATADGMRKLVEATGSDFIRYQMIVNDQYEKIAREKANAIRDMNPEIRVNQWYTGPGNETSKPGNWTSVFSDLMRVLPSQMTAVEDITGKSFVELFTGKDKDGKCVSNPVDVDFHTESEQTVALDVAKNTGKGKGI